MTRAEGAKMHRFLWLWPQPSPLTERRSPRASPASCRIRRSAGTLRGALPSSLPAIPPPHMYLHMAWGAEAPPLSAAPLLRVLAAYEAIPRARTHGGERGVARGNVLGLRLICQIPEF